MSCGAHHARARVDALCWAGEQRELTRRDFLSKHRPVPGHELDPLVLDRLRKIFLTPFDGGQLVDVSDCEEATVRLARLERDEKPTMLIRHFSTMPSMSAVRDGQ